LLETGWIKGMAHITGGGIPENLPRMLPEGRSYRLDDRSWSVPPVFEWLQSAGGVAASEMFRTFNMGVGLVLACAPANADALMARLRAAGEAPWLIGHTT
jgi:phosphoribosylaminoimidazole (AIR) synthetase